jgi:hypothetical protein
MKINILQQNPKQNTANTKTSHWTLNSFHPHHFLITYFPQIHLNISSHLLLSLPTICFLRCFLATFPTNHNLLDFIIETILKKFHNRTVGWKASSCRTTPCWLSMTACSVQSWLPYRSWHHLLYTGLHNMRGCALHPSHLCIKTCYTDLTSLESLFHVPWFKVYSTMKYLSEIFLPFMIFFSLTLKSTVCQSTLTKAELFFSFQTRTFSLL